MRIVRFSEQSWLRQAWRDLKGFVDEHVELAPSEKQLLTDRWLKEAEHYDDLWRRERRTHEVLTCTAIVTGLATSLLAAVGAARWTLAVAAFLVAASSALDGFFRLDKRWPHQRQTAVMLKAEGIRFLELRGPYRQDGEHRHAFPRFLEQLERINEQQTEAYLELQALRQDSSEQGS